jgi:hypothetical protein
LSRPCPTNVPSTETETETETETSSSKRESPVKRARKGAATASPRSQADPLASFPELEAAWPTLIRLLAEAHPYVVITDDRVAAMRKELADAARIDGLPAADIAACLTWLFKSPHRDAAFWRKNVQSFAGLRKSKTPGLPGKLQRILDAWAYAQSGRERTMGEEFGSIHATSDAAPAPSRQPKDHSKGPTMAELFNEPSPESDQ